MTDAAVLVAAVQLGDAVSAVVFAACRKAGANPVAWPAASESSGAAPSTPLLLVGALPPGERRIPAELVDVAVRLDLPVLLVCREPLVRPLVSTHSGRVTLLGQPATSARIQGTVRMLLAGRGADDSPAAGERLGPLAWTATFGPPGAVPLACQADDGSITALLSLAPEPTHTATAPHDLAHLANLVRADLSHDQTLALLSERLGLEAALVHLDAASASFTLYWPTCRPPYIYSRLRLPNLCALSALSPERRLYRVAASHGDLLVAVLGDEDWTHDAELCAVLADGGPAFLALLEGRSHTAGVLAEVR